MQTQLDFRLGTLVRWHGGGDPDAPEDIDELGIVIQMPGETAYYYIAWGTTNTVSHHTPDMVEESLYQQQMEIMG